MALGWTIETLYEHFAALLAERSERDREWRVEKDLRDQQRFESQEKAVSAALAAQKELVSAALSAADRAVLKAEVAANDRFNSVNEFRASLTDQTKEFPTKVVVDAKIESLQTQITALTSRSDRSEGSNRGLHAGWGYLVGGIGAVAAVMAMTGHLK